MIIFCFENTIESTLWRGTLNSLLIYLQNLSLQPIGQVYELVSHTTCEFVHFIHERRYLRFKKNKTFHDYFIYCQNFYHQIAERKSHLLLFEVFEPRTHYPLNDDKLNSLLIRRITHKVSEENFFFIPFRSFKERWLYSKLL